MGAFICDLAQGVGEIGEREIICDGLEPSREPVTREESAGKKHHREGHQVGDGCGLVFVFGVASHNEAECQEDEGTEYRYRQEVEDITDKMEVEHQDAKNREEADLEDANDETSHALGHHKLGRVRGRGLDAAQHAGHLHGDKGEGHTKYSELHNAHAENTRQYEIDGAQVIGFGAGGLDRHDLRRMGDLGVEAGQDLAEDEVGGLAAVGVALVEVRNDLGRLDQMRRRVDAAEIFRDNHLQVDLAFAKLVGSLGLASLRDLKSLHFLEGVDDAMGQLGVGFIGNIEGKGTAAGFAQEAEDDDEHERQKQRKENGCSVTEVHFDRSS